MSLEMEFTGERFVPQVHGNIELEHMHRYLMACDIAGGKDVLDIACGEGYGAAMLAQKARKVYGVDISNETVDHARAKYNASNISFTVGSCDAIPLPDHSVDLVVSFETIEHHDKHQEMMREIKRVLRPNGVIIISSPDKQVYSLNRNYSNPFHIKELFAAEFESLLSSYFNNVRSFGQKISYGSVIIENNGSAPQKCHWDEDGKVYTKEGSLKPVYLLIVASDSEIPLVHTGIYERPEWQSEHAVHLGGIIADRDEQLAILNQTIEERTAWALGLEAESKQKTNRILELQKEVEERTAWALGLEDESKQKARHVLELQKEVEERTAWALGLEDETKQKARHILELQKEVEERTAWALGLEDETKQKARHISELQKEVEERTAWALGLELECKQNAYRVSQLEKKIEKMLEAMNEREEELAEIRKQFSRLSNENRLLNEIVESAMAWQKRSWFKRAFHRWRPPHKPKNKIGRLRKLERSIRKRRKKLFQKNKFKILEVKPKTEVDLSADASGIRIFTSTTPKVSVIIPVYGQIEYTLECLKSIARNPPQADFEVIVIDDCSPDGSAKILKKIKSIRLVQNAQNSGFIRSCNAGAKVALGEYLYFLNNDTQVTPGWMDELLKTFDRLPGTGLVGSKLVYPDGSLQEAGGIIWKDGSAWNFGRNQDASLPIFNYAREVDYCSGASIMVPKRLFDELSGFDEHYLPAYCEDSDLALKIRDKGHRVIYQPLSVVVHFEGVSSGTDTSTGVKAYQVENMKKVYERWKHRLENHQPNAVDVDNAKDRVATRRVLFLDQCTPTPDMDSGSIDAFNTMMLLRDMGFQVTFIPVSNFHNDRKYTSAIQAHGIEALYHPHVSSVDQHLSEHGKRYDLIFACRHNTLEPHYHSLRKYAPQAKILFHTVDLHFLREKREADLLQDPKLHDKAKRTQDVELRLINECDLTTVVSHVEKQVLDDMDLGEKVRVMPYSRHIRGTSVPFSDRDGIVFVGGFQHAPNVDAVNYFVHEIMPHLRPLLPDVIFHVVGSKVPDEVNQLEGPDVRLHGYVEDLEPFLDQMRVSVAPLRYGAGIKGKVGSAMCAGLPVVASPPAAEGMNLTHGENVIIAQNPKEYAGCIAKLYQNEDLWNRISKNGIEFAERAWGGDAAAKNLHDILQRCEIKCSHILYQIRLCN